MSNIPSVDAFRFHKARDGIVMICPDQDCKEGRVPLGWTITFGKLKEAAINHRFNHMMASGMVGSGTER